MSIHSLYIITCTSVSMTQLRFTEHSVACIQWGMRTKSAVGYVIFPSCLLN
jgi:hypothetical protein